MRRKDHLGRLRVEHAEGVADRLLGIVLDDEPVRGDAPLAKRRQRPVEPSARRRSARVLVDDVAGAWRVHGREDCDELELTFRRPPLDRIDQLSSRDRLVRDHENVPLHVRTSSRSSRTTSRSPFMTACFAPGTPYSYGFPTTCGISSKLKSGGGEDTCHSSVIPRHGFPGARAPRIQLTIML